MVILFFHPFRRGLDQRFYKFIDDRLFRIISVSWVVLFFGCSHNLNSRIEGTLDLNSWISAQVDSQQSTRALAAIVLARLRW
jgi:hypothetical protein